MTRRTMTRRTTRQVCAVLGAALSAALLLGAPAHADPASADSTTVLMPMPGAGWMRQRSASGYQVPPVTLSEQSGTGGIDRDGTEGFIDLDGTEGTMTGPLMLATPDLHAAPAPTRRVRD